MRNRKPEVYFCSFADSRMAGPLKRIKRQAKEFNLFKRIIICSEKDLDKNFFAKHKNILSHNVRGYGYWIWKPQIIKQILEKIDDEEILLYTDAGCHLNPNGINKLNEYIDRLSKSKHYILATELENEYLEKNWSKGDLLNYFNVYDKKNITHTPQLQAGVILIKKCIEAEIFLLNWISVCDKNYRLIDDSESLIPNHDGFISHRHDQSAFSILCKINGCITIPNSDIYRNNTWSDMKNYPIWAMRDKWYQESLQKRITNKIKQLINNFL